MSKDLKTTAPVSATSSQTSVQTGTAERDLQATEGNAAVLARLEATGASAGKTGAPTSATQGGIDGPMGRVYQRITGSTNPAGFTRGQLRSYLDSTLGFAEGEWFRGAKLDGVADTLMTQLDVDKDGKVSWTEFQAFQTQTLQTVAPGATNETSARSAAGTRFDQLDTSHDGSLGFGELAAGTAAQLPANTDHADLISQLAARIALDAVDTDQRKSKVKDRSLSKGEWTEAAGEMAR